MTTKNTEQTLDDHTVAELKEIAEEEGAEFSAHDTKHDLIQAIKKNRQKIEKSKKTETGKPSETTAAAPAEDTFPQSVAPGVAGQQSEAERLKAHS